MLTCIVVSNGITLLLAIALTMSEWMARTNKIKENSIVKISFFIILFIKLLIILIYNDYGKTSTIKNRNDPHFLLRWKFWYPSLYDGIF